MGYTTTFEGSISIEPPLNEQEISFLRDFNDTRHVNRTRGPLYVGDDHADIINSNEPHLTCLIFGASGNQIVTALRLCGTGVGTWAGHPFVPAQWISPRGGHCGQ